MRLLSPIIISALLVISNASIAQTAIPPPTTNALPSLTLAVAIELATRANPDLTVARRELEAIDGVVMQSYARANPDISYQLEDTRQDSRTTTLLANQLIELGGKRAARIDAAGRSRDIALAELAAREAETRAMVTGNFYEVMLTQERVKLLQGLVDIARNGMEAAGKRVQAGKISPVEETRAHLSYANAQIDLAQAQSDLTIARQRLAAMWGEATPRFTSVIGSVDTLPALMSMDTLQTLLAVSPNLQRAQFEIARRQALTNLERAKRLPDVTISLGVKRDAQGGRSQTVLGVSIPIPLFDGNRGNLHEASKREDKARDERVALQTQLRTHAFEAREHLQAARAQAETLQRDVLPGAQSAYDAATKGFEWGKFSFLDVLDAQRTLFQAKSQHLKAVAEAHRAASELNRLLGHSAAAINIPAPTSYAKP